MAFLGWLGRALGPIVLEHSLPMLRDWWKGRQAQPASRTDQFQLLASDVEALKAHATRVDSSVEGLNANLEQLNQGFTAREEKLRKGLLVLFIWNSVMTIGVLLLAALALRR